MPHRKLEYDVLYHMERGPSREAIYDSARLGDHPNFNVLFTFRGEHNDYIGDAVATVEGVHRMNPVFLFLMGRLMLEQDSRGHPLDEIWHKAFYFAQYNLRTHRGRILLGKSSFLESPLKKFGPYKEAEPEI